MTAGRHALLIRGRVPRETLRSVLYASWRVDALASNHDGRIVAVVSCPHGTAVGFGPLVQAERIRSLGGVGVLEAWEDADMLAAILALFPRSQVAS